MHETKQMATFISYRGNTHTQNV